MGWSVNLAYLQCGPHPCTPPAAIRDWNSFHHDWNLLEFFPILSTHCMECYNLHGVHNLHGMYSFEQHSISLNSVAQPFAALQSLCRALQMSRVHVRKKNYPSQPAQQPRLAYKLGLAQM